MGRFDPAATAAAAALALVVWSQTLHPFGNDRWRIWVDVLADEWLIWFTALYLALVGGTALASRLGEWRNAWRHGWNHQNHEWKHGGKRLDRDDTPDDGAGAAG